MKQIRMYLGIFLILLAIGGLIFWEMIGREAILTEPILVAKETIPQGKLVSESDFISIGILPESRMRGALSPARVDEIIGEKTKQLIPQNAQISKHFFENDDFYLKETESIFAIKEEWIALRSSSLRRGDWIDIYETGEMKLLGCFQIAFVKDEKELEVRDNNGTFESELKRTDANAVISHVEIISDILSYQKILACVKASIESNLLLVQAEANKKS